MIALDHLEVRNQLALAQFLRRTADRLEGKQLPDPRDHELQDRGAVLDFNRRLARRTGRAPSQFAAELAAAGLRATDLMALTGVKRGTVWRWMNAPTVPVYVRTIVRLQRCVRDLTIALTTQTK